MFQQYRQPGIFTLPDGFAKCQVNLPDCSNAIKWLFISHTGQLIENSHQGFICKKVFTKDFHKMLLIKKGGKHDEGKQAFGTMPAPGVRFTSDVATFKNRVILWKLRKQESYLQLIQRSQETEIIDLSGNPFFT